MLILDELGYLPLTREEASLFFRLLVRRYERASLIVTSNKSFADWGEVFNDQVLATAILDRLLHHATTVNIKGDSYRLREKKKAGLLGRKPKAAEPEEAGVPGVISGTRTSVNRGHLTSVFSGQVTSALTEVVGRVGKGGAKDGGRVLRRGGWRERRRERRGKERVNFVSRYGALHGGLNVELLDAAPFGRRRSEVRWGAGPA